MKTYLFSISKYDLDVPHLKDDPFSMISLSRRSNRRSLSAGRAYTFFVYFFRLASAVVHVLSGTLFQCTFCLFECGPISRTAQIPTLT